MYSIFVSPEVQYISRSQTHVGLCILATCKHYDERPVTSNKWINVVIEIHSSNDKWCLYRQFKVNIIAVYINDYIIKLDSFYLDISVVICVMFRIVETIYLLAIISYLRNNGTYINNTLSHIIIHQYKC